MKKTLRVTANIDGWYSIKASCDEGSILVNMKLEAGKPLELSFMNDRPSLNRLESEKNSDKTGHKPNGRLNHKRLR